MLVSGVPEGSWSEHGTLLRPWLAAGSRATFTNVMFPAGILRLVVKAAIGTGGTHEGISSEPLIVMQPEGGVSHGLAREALARAYGDSQALLDVVMALMPEINGTNPDLAQLLFGTILTIASNASAGSEFSKLGTIQRLGTTIRDAVNSFSTPEPSLLHLAATSLEHAVVGSVDSPPSIANQLPKQVTQDALTSVLEGIHAVGLAYVNLTRGNSSAVGQHLVAATLGCADKLIASLQPPGLQVFELGTAGPGPMALALSVATVSGEFTAAGINLFNGMVQLPAGAWKGRRLTSACSSLQFVQAEWHEYNALHFAARVGDGRPAVWPDTGLKVLEFKGCGKPLQLGTPARFALHVPRWPPVPGNVMPVCVVFNRTVAAWSRLGITTEVADLQQGLVWCQSSHNSGAYAVAAELRPRTSSGSKVIDTSTEPPNSLPQTIGIYVASFSSAATLFLVCVGVACILHRRRADNRRRSLCEAEDCSDMDEGMDEHFGGSGDIDAAIAESENEALADIPRSTMIIRKPYGAPDASSVDSYGLEHEDTLDESEDEDERQARDNEEALEDTEFTQLEHTSVWRQMPRRLNNIDIDEICAARAAGSGRPAFLVRGNVLPNPAGDNDEVQQEPKPVAPPILPHWRMDSPSRTPPPSPRIAYTF